MKTKIVLSIAMLVISVMGYASDEETNIPIEKMRYAMNHPQQGIVIDSTCFRAYSPTMVYFRDVTDKMIIFYKDGKIRGPYKRTTKSAEYPSYHLIFWIIVGLVCSFFWGYKRYIVCELLSVLICFNAIQPNVYWWIPILTFLVFGVTIVFGSLLRIKEKKQFKK